MKRLLALTLLATALVLPAEARADELVSAEADTETSAEVNVDTSAEVNVETSTETSSSGCRRVDVARIGRSILGFVVYKFHQVKKWCWSYPRITWKEVYTYVSDVDPNMDYRGVVSAVGYFYTWCCSSGYSGHYSLRVGKFENCEPVLGCIRTEYPWVKIWARGDGSYRWATGV